MFYPIFNFVCLTYFEVRDKPMSFIYDFLLSLAHLEAILFYDFEEYSCYHCDFEACAPMKIHSKYYKVNLTKKFKITQKLIYREAKA